MKKILLLLLVLLMVTGITDAQKRSQDRIYYYYKGEKVYYPLSNDRLVVGIAPGTVFARTREAVAATLSMPADSIVETQEGKQFIIKLGKNNEADIAPIVGRLLTLSGVQFARPVYKSESGKYCSYGAEFIVDLKPGTTLKQLQTLAEQQGCTIVRKQPFVDNMYILAAGKTSGYNGLNMANIFYETGLFNYAEPDKVVYDAHHADPNDPKYPLQWGHKNTGSAAQYSGVAGQDMKVQDAWNITMGKSYIKVGVIDEGVDLTHPDLAANILQGFNGATLTSNPGDGAPLAAANAHGTNCAGIIAAIANNNLGIAGVAPNCKIISGVIFGSTGVYIGDAAVAGSFDYVRLQGADVISNSWGGGSVSSTIDAAINRAVTLGRRGRGCMVLFSSGNGNTGVSYPANNNQTVAVGGVNMFGKRKSTTSADGETWWGANYGTNLDVVAPCVKIAATDIQGTGGYNTSAGTAGDYFDTFNGTSSACPNAAGVAALIYSVDTNLTVAQARQVLESSCDKLTGYTYAANVSQPNGTWENETGYGRVNAFSALQLATTGNFCAVGIQSSGTLICNGNVTLSVTIPDAAATYLWRRNGAAVATGTSFATSVPGVYDAVVTKGTCTATSGTIELTTPFTATISSSRDTVCAGTGITLTANVATPPISYCTTSYSRGTGFGDSLTLVSIAGTTLNNATGGAASPFYTLFPASGNTTATLNAGTAYTMSVRGGSYSVQFVRGWIDYNQNGIFESTETIGISPNVGNSVTNTITFTVPAGAVNGQTRLRIRNSDTSPGPGAGESCGNTNSGYGETEDYVITISGGAALYTYAWTESPAGTTLSSTSGPTVSANNITAAKTYSVTVTSAGGCVVSTSRPIVVTSASFSSTFVRTNVSCFGSSTGAVTVTVTGGKAPYIYKNGPTGTFQSSNSFTGLRAGNYRIYFQDANGCTGFTAIVSITQPAAALVVNGSSTNIPCNGSRNGTITATATGGTPPYQYKNNAGAYQSSGTFSNLAPGNYRIYAIDSNGCTAFTGVFAITQPALLVATVTKTDATCTTTANGSVTATLTGGTPPYLYSIASAGPYQSAPTFSNLLPGSYRIFYRDANNCSGFTPIITVGPAPMVVSGRGTNPSCNGAADGTITGTVTGGRPPYKYARSSAGPYQTSSLLTGLRAGNYRVFVMDSSGCTAFSPIVSLTNPANSCVSFAKGIAPQIVTDEALSVQLSPNPATDAFVVKVKGKTNVPVTIRVVDVNGRQMELLSGTPGQTLRVGRTLQSGIYLLEVRQGSETKTVKAVKIR